MARESSQQIKRFWDWVRRAMEEKDLSFRQIEMQAGVANASVSRRARENWPPTDMNYEVLSDALDVPKRELMERAGVIESVDELLSHSDIREIHEMLKHLTPNQVENVRRYIQFQFPRVYETVLEGIPEPETEGVEEPQPQPED